MPVQCNPMKLQSLQRQQGTSLLEVLMAVVILTFGLLGLAALQGKSHTAQLESYQRGQALALLQDMVSRMESNTGNIASYVTTAPLGTGATDTAECNSETTLALRDKCEWSKALKGASEVKSGVNKGTMIDGRGCIAATGTVREYQISVVWKGMSEGTDQSWITCGDDQYMPALSRRAVTTIVQVPDLAAP